MVQKEFAKKMSRIDMEMPSYPGDIYGLFRSLWILDFGIFGRESSTFEVLNVD
jgi:hypothetical protein